MEKICSIAKDFNNSNRINLYNLVSDRINRSNISSLEKENVINCLKDNPDYIVDWLLYSENKRTSSGWYFKLHKKDCIVGFIKEGVIEKEKIFVSKYEACAEYIIIEIKSILNNS